MNRVAILIFLLAVVGCSETVVSGEPLTATNTTEMKVQNYLRQGAKYPDSIVVEYCGGMRSSKNTTTKDAFCLFRGRDRSGSRVRIGTTFFFHEDGRITQLYGGGE